MNFFCFELISQKRKIGVYKYSQRERQKKSNSYKEKESICDKKERE